MRSVVTRRFGYIWNGWADGKTIFRNESQNGLTMKAMVEAARNDTDIAARVDLFLKRVPEELYDYEADPAATVNLIDKPEHRERVNAMRKQLHEHMKATGDPKLSLFEKQVALQEGGE